MDVPELEYDIEGKISPEALFTVRRSGTKLPMDKLQLPVEAYVRAFQESGVLGWADSFNGSFVAPGLDTTLAQIDSLVQQIHERRLNLMQAKERLQAVSAVVDRRHRDRVLTFGKSVEAYVQQANKMTTTLVSQLKSQPVRSVDAFVQGEMQSLRGQEERLRTSASDLS